MLRQGRPPWPFDEGDVQGHGDVEHVEDEVGDLGAAEEPLIVGQYCMIFPDSLVVISLFGVLGGEVGHVAGTWGTSP